jgi:hypothetical protein
LHHRRKLVGATGIEPVTPTMSRYHQHAFSVQVIEPSALFPLVQALLGTCAKFAQY